METYIKIQTVFFRDPSNNYKTLLEGQYAKPEFEWLATNRWLCTEKIDGTNIRVMFDGEKVWCNGKTDNAQTPGDLLKHLYETFTVDKMRDQFGEQPTEVCLYGEGHGAGIQSGGYYRPDKAFILFDVKIGSVWLERSDVADVADGLNCPLVPTLWTGTLPEAVQFVKTGFNSQITNTPHLAEGLVMRPETELFNRRGERVITKLKYSDFPR